MFEEQSPWDFDYLGRKLSKEDFKRIDELREPFCDSEDVKLKAAFNYGMKLGIMLMAEVCLGMKEIVREDR